MAILETEVSVLCISNRIKYYEELGYEIPKYLNKSNREVVSKATEITVKIEHIPKGSQIKVFKVCDYCGKTAEKQSNYCDVLRYRAKTGKDTCDKCKYVKSSEAWGNRKTPIGESTAERFPHLLKEWNPEKNKIDLLNILPNSRKSVWWICEEKSHEYEMPVVLKSRGFGCPYCTNKRVADDNCLVASHPQIASEWHPTKNGEDAPKQFTFGTDKKIWWLGECGHEWKQSIVSRTSRNAGCTICNQSKGENAIFEYLTSKNISFKMQYSFEGLVGEGGRFLKYDFAVFDGKEMLKCLLEFDGAFHFKSYYDDDAYKKIVAYDKLKNEYCKDNNIALIRISYHKLKSIEKILDRELSKLTHP